jgi:hypothetical protein
VEGFPILASQLDSGANLAVLVGAHHPGVLLAVRAWISSSSGVAICIRFFLYCCAQIPLIPADMVWCFAADGFNVDLSQAFRQTVVVIPISPVGNPFLDCCRFITSV